MKIRVWHGGAAVIFVLGLGFAFMPGTFLYRIIPVPPANTSNAYVDHLQDIAPIVRKKTILPSGLVNYAIQEKLHMPLFYLIPTKHYLFTVRDYLNERLGVTGLKWNYDATEDAVVLDFVWHRSVTQTGKELVAQISKTTPVPMESLPISSEQTFNPWGSSPNPWKLDPWRVALDELMSEPENFPHAWKVRLQSCCSFEGTMVDTAVLGGNLYSHLLKDDGGKEHLFVLQTRSPLTTKSYWSYTYYLFDADGNWEDGGIFEMGDIWTHPDVVFTTVDIIDSNDKIKAGNVQAVINTGMHTNNAFTYILPIKDGKVGVSVYKNSVVLDPSKYAGATNMTPLRHIGD